ncbi:MAG: coiled-coil protein [Candidatus Heimdallarchaeota archaeon]|nr:MAG: hypothetical protein DRO63_00240 [Candidatus Gerdarchaeota archaeon]
MNETIDVEEEFKDHPEVIALQRELKGMSKEVMKKTMDSLRTEITQISTKIAQLKKKREEHNAEARHYRAMRDNVSGDKFSNINQLRERAKEEKEARDRCNEEIRKYKKIREELKEKIRAAWGKVKELREKYYQMKDEVGVIPEEITNEIRDLEWKQQTTILTLEEDAYVTKRITELYEKAYTAHLIGFSSSELEAAVEQAKQLSKEQEEAHQKVLFFHEEGQKHHEAMQQIYKELDELRAGGDKMHQKYLEARQAADLAHKNIVELYNQIKLNQFLIELIEDEQSRRRHEQILKQKAKKIEETKKKQTAKKSLSLDELRLLLGEDEEENGTK